MGLDDLPDHDDRPELAALFTNLHHSMNNGGKDTDIQVGEIVLVRDGPFAGFRGTVVEVRPQVLHLDVSVWARPIIGDGLR